MMTMISHHGSNSWRFESPSRHQIRFTMLPVRPTDISFHFPYVSRILARCRETKYEEILDKHNQLSITGRDGTNVTDGIGSLWDYQLGKFTAETGDFTVINDDFKDDVCLMRVIGAVKEDAAKHGKLIGRIRFMRLKPKTCLTLHKDPDEFRYHMPLETSYNCFFVVGTCVFRMPKVGQVYLLDTREEHTAINASNNDRIHLVFDTFDAKP